MMMTDCTPEQARRLAIAAMALVDRHLEYRQSPQSYFLLPAQGYELKELRAALEPFRPHADHGEQPPTDRLDKQEG